jgi:hypothetical protein
MREEGRAYEKRSVGGAAISRGVAEDGEPGSLPADRPLFRRRSCEREVPSSPTGLTRRVVR